MSHYNEYFDIQYGGGRHGGIEHVYIGSPNQRGHGIGSFLGGLFRRVLPLLSKGAKAIGKEAIRSGMHIASDVIDKDISLKEAFNARVRDSTKNLKRKAEEKLNSIMEGSGSGYKIAKVSNFIHSNGVRGRRRVVKAKKKKKKVIKKQEALKVKKTQPKKKKKNRTVVDIFR